MKTNLRKNTVRCFHRNKHKIRVEVMGRVTLAKFNHYIMYVLISECILYGVPSSFTVLCTKFFLFN